MKVRCDFCRRLIQVVQPGTATPWLVKHKLGAAADLRGGQTPKTMCQGSLLGVRMQKRGQPS